MKLALLLVAVAALLSMPAHKAPLFAAAAEEEEGAHLAVEDVDEDEEFDDDEDGAFDDEEGEYDEEEEEEEDLGPHADIDTDVVFAHANGVEFIIGEPIEAVCGFFNGGDDTFTVQSAKGTIFSEDYSQLFANMTATPYNVTVGPQGEASFAYKMELNPNLDPQVLGLTLEIFYATEDGNFSTVFFNSTVSMIESAVEANTDAVFLYVTGAAGAALVGAIIYRTVGGAGGKKKKKPSKAKPVLEGTKKSGKEVDGQWLEGTLAMAHERNKSRSPSPRRRRN